MVRASQHKWMCMYIHKEKLMENKMDEFLLRYFAGELDKTEERELLDWLNRDDEHKKTFRRIADTWAVAHIPLFVGRLKADSPMLPRARRNIVMLRKRWTGVTVGHYHLSDSEDESKNTLPLLNRTIGPFVRCCHI